MIVKGELVGVVAGVQGFLQRASRGARWLAERSSRSAAETRSASQPKRKWVEHVCGTTRVRPPALATLGSQLLAQTLP